MSLASVVGSETPPHVRSPDPQITYRLSGEVGARAPSDAKLPISAFAVAEIAFTVCPKIPNVKSHFALDGVFSLVLAGTVNDQSVIPYGPTLSSMMSRRDGIS
jgi:hypothetical protein